jgi:hypothetical protein
MNWQGGDILTGSRIYLQPKLSIVNTILDIVELQNGRTTFTDTRNGRVHFTVSMYGYEWEYRFDIRDIGRNRSRVTIDVEGDTKNKTRQIVREFALLDSMLVSEAQIEYMDQDDAPHIPGVGVLGN